MPTCPFCQADLSTADLQSGQCPHCRRTLPSDAGKDRPATAGDSAPEDEKQPAPPDEKSDTADDRRTAETLDAGALPVPPPAEAAADEADTADERRVAETLDAGVSPIPPPSEEEPGRAGGRRADTPRDAAELTREVREKMSGMWSGSIRPQASPLASVKPESRALVAESKLIIQPRKVLQQKESEAAGADYQLIETLGEGGMGVVYAARQASINRTVAVKMLKAVGAADHSQRETFLAEAVVTGDLEHPNIVPIYDLGTNEQGALFYSMKRVKGTPWNTVISRKSFQENLDVLMRLADAVAFAHSRGVLHRDLKPENVMLGDFGEVLLMDWGLAVSLTRSDGSGMGGTPAYMAPEMATGPVERIGLTSDVYLLGAILFEILTGKPPHAGENAMQCLFAAAKNEIRSTEKSGELLDIARRAMATAPRDRYPSVQALQAAIREYQAHSESVLLSTRAEEDLQQARQSEDYQVYARALFGFQEALSLWDANARARSGASETTLAYATSALRKSDFDLGASLLDPDDPAHAELHKRIKAAQRERDARQQRLRTAKRALVAMLGTILIIVTVAFFWIQAKEREARASEAVAKREAKRAGKAETRATDEAKRARIAEADANKEKDRANNERDRANKEKDRALKAETAALQAKKKEAYEAYIARIGLANAKIDENAFDKAVELLGQCPLELRGWEWGYLMHLCTQALQTFEAPQPLDSVAFSPDAKRIVAGGWGGTARIWNAESGQELAEIPTGGEYVFAVAFSPDGSQVATGTNDRPGYVKIWDAETGALLKALRGHRDAVLSVTYSGDGKQLLTSSYDGMAILWDLQTAAPLKTFRGHDWWVWSAAFSPDEQRIVTASQDGSAIVWTVATGEAGPPFFGHTGPVYTATFSPDGKRVASGGNDKRVLLWDPDQVKPFQYDTLMSGQRNPPPVFEALEGHTAAVCSVRFSSDGRWLLSGGNDNAVRVWEVASGRLLKTLRGHAGRVRACAFSPDGRQVLSCSHDGHAKTWSIAGYEDIRVFRGPVLEGHEDAVLGASFSPDGQTILSASRDRTARAWDVDSGKPGREFKEGHKFLVSAAVFFPDGKRLVTAAVDSTARVWDVETGTQLLVLQQTGPSAAVALSHDGKRILTGSDDDTAKLWDAESGKLLRTLPNHHGEVTAAAFSPDDRLLFTGDASGRCRLWDAETAQAVWEAKKHSRDITAAFFLPDASRVLTASTDNTVAQWDVETGQEQEDLILKHPDAVTSMALSPDGQYALTACPDRTIPVRADGADEETTKPLSTVRLWQLDTAKEIAKLATGNELINSVAFSPDGRRAVTTSAENTVRLWDLQTRQEITVGGAGGPLARLAASGERTWSAVFSPDGAAVLTVGGRDAHLWNVHDGREMITFSPHAAVASANFSPNGRRVVTGGWDNTARIWNFLTGQAELKLEGEHTRFVNSAVFSPDGRLVLTASDDTTAKLWDTISGKLLRTFSGHGQSVRSAVFSPDGKRVLTASADKTARIWNAETDEVLHVLKGHGQAVLGAAFSKKGDRVITGSEDNTAKLWDAATGQQMPFSLEGHTASVTSVAFSPDGRRAITGSRDNTAKLWDAETGKEILTLRGHSQEVTSVAFSPEPDGYSALTGGRDGILVLWPAVEWQEQESSKVSNAGPNGTPGSVPPQGGR